MAITSAKAKWFEFWQRLGVKNNPEPYFAELEAYYSEPHRAYHNLVHVMECLEEFKLAKHLASNPLAVEMAIWYHDVVYDSRTRDNEEQSAALAAKVSNASALSELFTQRVTNLILATKKHDAALDQDAALMTDIDLSILGRCQGRFDEYEHQIRQEYNWVSPSDFVAGRTAVLKSFLCRRTIYATEFFQNKYEQQARENLNRSVLMLQRQAN